MEEHSGPDMRIVIEEALSKQGILQNAKVNSEQQKAKDKILEKLPRNVNGSYSVLQFGLNGVIRLLNTRTAAKELDRMLDQSMSSHEAAIKNMQRSLTADEIAELNELLSWVLFGYVSMTLDELESVMWLYSGVESLTPLEYIVKSKYSAVLKIEDGYVYAQDGVQEYLEKKKDLPGRSSLSKDRPTISMTVTINNVDQELCGHFLWDLADMAIRDKFKFNFNGDTTNTIHNSSHGAIAVDEFEANHTIVTRAFDYLMNEPSDQAKSVGTYFINWLPYHLGRLRLLEDDDKGALTPHEQHAIGQNLYHLFKDNSVFQRHQAIVEQGYWESEEMESVQKWLMDSAVVRRLDRRWRAEVQQATNPVRGYLKNLVKMVVVGLLRGRNWDVSNAVWWLKNFIAADEKKVGELNKPSDANFDDAGSSASSSAASNSNIDWDHVSTWCQGILGLSESELDSLWYERLASASSGYNADSTLSLYQKAIEKNDPSWLCYRGLGETYYDKGLGAEAAAQVEIAIKEAGREGATPKPEAKDIAELHLLLGEYAYREGNISGAAEHYTFVCGSDDAEQAIKGELGHLKVMLSSPGFKEAIKLLEKMLAKESEDGSMVRILKMVARDYNQDFLLSNMFTIAKEDPDVLKGLLRTVQTATAEPTPFGDSTTEILSQDDHFAEDESRGILLYHLGVAIYTYKVSPNGIDPVDEALRLWVESRNQLSRIGGGNAFLTRSNATSLLANHYFQTMMDGGLNQDYLDTLEKLAKEESGSGYNYAAGFLGVLYSLHNEKEKARAVLAPKIKEALQVLSDDTPDNDNHGFFVMRKAMEQYLEFENVAIALSFVGQPDIVTDALNFEAKDIPGDDDKDKQTVLDTVTKLSKDTVRVAKTQVPDSPSQLQRIKAAKTHVDSLLAGPDTDTDPATVAAHSLLQSRLSELEQLHTPELSQTDWIATCDGRAPDGKACPNECDFEREFYHCTYCANRDFCRDCLARVRNPGPSVIDTRCSAKHRWLRMPPMGDDMYVGLKAKSTRVPRSVGPLDGDEQILVVRYAEDGGGKEITLEAWMERVATEWGISLREIKDDMSRQATPDGETVQGEVDEGTKRTATHLY